MRRRTGAVIAAIAALALAFTTAPASAVGAATDPRKVGAMYQQFNTDAKVGRVDTVYRNYWQPYPEGMSDKYFSDSTITVHDSRMDIATTGTKGAAGTFGSPSKAWEHVGGTFSIRLKTTGGAGNGLAVMLWPLSNDQGEGELDYPEAGYAGRGHVYHHLMAPNDPAKSIQYDTGASFREWHTYSIEWKAGAYVRYYLDGKLVFTVTSNVPTTAHRYMIQTGNYGAPGHVFIDWVRTTE